MQGLLFASDQTFAELLDVLQDELSRLYWLLDLQSGPFDVYGQEDYAELDRELDRLYIDVPRFETSSNSLWRPGIFPEFAPLLYEDAHSYLVGFSANEDTAAGIAESLLDAGDYLTRPFFTALEQRAKVFAAKISSRWEVYPTDTAWLDHLQAERKGQLIDSAKWDRE